MNSLHEHAWVKGATLKDVAARAGVSLKTASRVLNNDSKVATATRSRVREAMSSLNYEPDPAARSLRAGHDKTVGVIVDSIGDIFFSRLAATMETALDEAGYGSLLASSNMKPLRERDIIRNLVRRRCAGIIAAPTSAESITAADLAGTPIVFVDRIGAVDGAVSVITDDFGMAKAATQHLLSFGHKRVAVLSDSQDIQTTQGRLEGYRQALRDAGLDVHLDLMCTDCDDEALAMDAVRRVLASENPATGIFSCSSRLSLGVVPALHQFGRTDVAFISFGDFVLAGSVQPPVTVVDHSPERIGRAAVAALLERLHTSSDRHSTSPVIEVPAALIPRGTGELSAPKP